MRTTTTFLLICIGFSVYASNESDFSKLISEWGTSINVKYMLKPWKKNINTWKKSTLEDDNLQNTIKQVKILESDLGKKLVTEGWTTRRTEWINQCSSSKDYLSLANLIIELEKTINILAYNPNWPPRRIHWKEEMTTIATNIKQVSEQFVVAKQPFQEVFQKLFIEALSGFETVIDGNKSYQKKSEGGLFTYYQANILMPQGNESYISEDKDGIFEYFCLYKAGSFESNAETLLDNFREYVAGIRPEGYVINENVDISFVNRLSYTLEFDSEKFIDIGKRATATFGIVEENEQFLVLVKVSEPVFKK